MLISGAVFCFFNLTTNTVIVMDVVNSDNKKTTESPQNTRIKKEYHINGTLKSETPYTNGQIHGIIKEYDENGKLIGTIGPIDGP